MLYTTVVKILKKSKKKQCGKWGHSGLLCYLCRRGVHLSPLPTLKSVLLVVGVRGAPQLKLGHGSRICAVEHTI